MSETVATRDDLSEYPRLMNPVQVQEALGLKTVKTVYTLIRNGELPHRRAGRHILVPRVGVVDFLERDRTSA